MKKVIPLYEEFLNEAKVNFKKLEADVKAKYPELEVSYTSFYKELEINGDSNDLGLERGDEFSIGIKKDGTADWTVWGGQGAGKEIGSDTDTGIFKIKDVEELITYIQKNY